LTETFPERPVAADAHPEIGRLPRGFSFATAHCGIKKRKVDLGVLVSETPASAAAVFTRNRVKAAPVQLCIEHISRSAADIRAVVVNSGNANCCTGSDGLKKSRKTAAVAARLLKCKPENTLVCSTGVIGIPLAVEKILDALPATLETREATPAAFDQFSRAILTTDTRQKVASASCVIGGKQVRIVGCAKGAGMIHPNMATMLAFMVTDATIGAALLARALRSAVADTFNAITIDGDTSTNDTAMVLANGQSGAKRIRTAANPEFKKFAAALRKVCHALALEIVGDGEGAQRVIEIEVRGAKNTREADQIARTIAHSPLVKTACAGADPNWGRILAAAGRSGVAIDPEHSGIKLAGITVCRRGQSVPFNEKRAHEAMLEKHVPILLDLHAGPGRARVWTCDFTTEYVTINASYRS
jgi:glutamate N-acetyltransferase / amino-acid N-acetyltransferase